MIMFIKIKNFSGYNLSLRGLPFGSKVTIFSKKYIIYLKKELIRWQKLFEREKKISAKAAQRQMKKKKNKELVKFNSFIHKIKYKSCLERS